MAFPTSVNDQITDSVTQSNVEVLGDAPAQAMGSLYQATAQALATAAQNAVSHQQNLDTLGRAVLASAVNSLLGTSDSTK